MCVREREKEREGERERERERECWKQCCVIEKAGPISHNSKSTGNPKSEKMRKGNVNVTFRDTEMKTRRVN